MTSPEAGSLEIRSLEATYSSDSVMFDPYWVVKNILFYILQICNPYGVIREQ